MSNNSPRSYNAVSELVLWKSALSLVAGFMHLQRGETFSRKNVANVQQLNAFTSSSKSIKTICKHNINDKEGY